MKAVANGEPGFSAPVKPASAARNSSGSSVIDSATKNIVPRSRENPHWPPRHPGNRQHPGPARRPAWASGRPGRLPCGHPALQENGIAHTGRPTVMAAVPSGEQPDRLIGIREVRALFGLGRTAAYELVRRTGFPEVVCVSPRAYRWWASQVHAFAAELQAAGPPHGRRSAATRPVPESGGPPLRITGTVRYARSRGSRQPGAPGGTHE
jgi:predicted DNA-binding transcriptional regulator AlpA